MLVRLTFVSGSQTGTRVQADPGEEITLGRRPESVVVFARDEVIVSGRHATVFVRDGATWIRDAESRNGTFVNGERVEGERRLAPGDEVTLGPSGPKARAEAVGAGADSALETAYVPAAGLAAATPPPGGGKPSGSSSSGSGLTGLYMLAREGADHRAGGRASQTAIMKEFVRLAADRTSRRNRMVIGAVGVAALFAVGLTYYMGQRERLGLEAELAQLMGAFESERGQRAALEERMQSLAGQAENWRSMSESLRTQTVEMREQVQRSREELAEQRQAVERDRRFGTIVTERYAAGVGLIHAVCGFRDSEANWLHLYVDDEGVLGLSTSNGVPITFAPTGTGWLVDPEGWIVTNRHVAAMCEGSDLLEPVLSPELVQRFPSAARQMRIFLPPGDRVYDVTVEQVYPGDPTSPDIALLKTTRSVPDAAILPVHTDPRPAPGEEVVLLGYPGGAGVQQQRIWGAGEDAMREIEEAGQQAAAQAMQQLGWPRLKARLDRTQQMNGNDSTQLLLARFVANQAFDDGMLTHQARMRLINSVVSKATVSDTSGRQVLYQIQGGTIGGSSGGPVIGPDLRVAAVHWGGSGQADRGSVFMRQQGVRARFVWELIPDPVARRMRQVTRRAQD